ncbi:MAG: hypothetical protein MN733_24580 [Nitrososphaera sp.]|nr:hypothetical protein [Nitrososphaera sp.]
MKSRICAISVFVISILLAACAPSSPQTSTPDSSAVSEPIAGPVVPVGQPEIVDTGPTTEVVWNCGDGGGIIVKHPSRSVSTGYAVEWEVGGTVGTGLIIGEGVLPGGVELTSSLEGHVASQFNQGVQQGLGWDLPAGENTIVIYTIMWREIWQPGYVNVTLADKSIARVNVKYRTGFQSDITGKAFQVCDGEQGEPPPTPAPAPIPEQTLIPAPVGTWLYNINQLPAAGTQLTWELDTGEVLILTGGRIRYSNFYCGDDSSQICVLIIHATRSQNITITDLIAQNNWLGVTNLFNTEEALSDVEPWFWRSPNCISGCSKATVAFFENQQLTDTRTIQR